MRGFDPKEYRVVSLRECPVPEEMVRCTTPQNAVDYWRLHIQTEPHFDPERECLAILFLTTRRKVRGQQLLSMGTKDSLLVDPQSVYRTGIVTGAAAIVVMHNHPSGEADPSEADIRVTRELKRAGQLLKIEMVDHIIVGAGTPGFRSLRELGYLL